jgi:hypothetical protein
MDAVVSTAHHNAGEGNMIAGLVSRHMTDRAAAQSVLGEALLAGDLE